MQKNLKLPSKKILNQKNCSFFDAKKKKSIKLKRLKNLIGELEKVKQINLILNSNKNCRINFLSLYRASTKKTSKEQKHEIVKFKKIKSILNYTGFFRFKII